MTTLNELLRIPRFSNLVLLTDETQADTIVERIEISETPDVANFVPERILLLTTAMIYQNDQRQLFSLMDSLKEKQAAGIGIKIGRFLDKIDSCVIDYGNQIGLPVLLIPDTLPLGTLLHQLLTYLWDSKAEQMSYALDIQKKFSDLLIQDVSLPRFLVNLGKLIQTPVLLISPWYKEIAHSQHFVPSGKPAEYYLTQLNRQYGNWLSQEKNFFIVQDLNDKPISISGFPIKVDNYFPYYLLILHPENVPYPLSEFAVEQACLILSYMLYKNQKVDESLEFLKSEFWAQLVDIQPNPQNSKRDWLTLGGNYGLRSSSYYQVIYVSCLPSDQTATKIKYQQEESHIVLQWLQEKLLPKIKHSCIFQIKNTNHLAILIQKKQTQLDKILTKLSTELTKKLPIHIQFAMGSPREEIDQLANSFIEAKIAYEETLSMDEPPIVHHYIAKGMKSLFENMPQEEVRYFCQTILHELAYPTDNASRELRKTLTYYLDFQCEISKTASALYLHRNTIKYRINHCEKILGVSIHDPRISLNLRIALALSDTDQSH